MKVVLQKYIASTGLCSRRKAEEFIKSGKVTINGEVAELGGRAEASDEVKVNGSVIKPITEKMYIKLNKPVGFTCTSRGFKDEKNIYELLAKEHRNLHVVGRLDKNSRGLVILTNDGEFTEIMAHPRFSHEKEYHVTIANHSFPLQKKLIAEIIQKLSDGVEIGDGDGVVAAKEVTYITKGKFKIILTEGKKRQIRRMFKSIGEDVLDLCRVRMGEIEIGGTREGSWRGFKLSD